MGFCLVFGRRDGRPSPMKDAAVLAAFENDREALENLISQLQDVRFHKITWENGKLIPEANFDNRGKIEELLKGVDRNIVIVVSQNVRGRIRFYYRLLLMTPIPT
jgi:hypothetical protein